MRATVFCQAADVSGESAGILTGPTTLAYGRAQARLVSCANGETRLVASNDAGHELRGIDR
jgi:hypothetical protein